MMSSNIACTISRLRSRSMVVLGIRHAPRLAKQPPPLVRRQSTTTTTSSTTTPTELSGHHSVLPPRSIIVDNPKIQAMLPIIGNVAYVALASGFLMTDMLSLRVLLAGGYAGLVTFHMLHVKPLKIPLRWSALFVAVNAGAAVLLLADQYTGNLSADDQALYQEHFSMLSPGQFQQLLAMAKTEVVPHGTALTEEGIPCKNLYFVRQGVVNLYLKKLFMSRSGAGSFVNDVAFTQGPGAGAYGTVVTAGPCTVLVWNKEQLRQYLDARPAMKQSMKHCFASHLVKALMEQREAAHLTSGRWGEYQVPHFTPRRTVDVREVPNKTTESSS